jgi:aspartate/methionine/tyrosine aminotransferase
LLPVEGGWSLVVRVPAFRSEEALTLELLERERVVVHPGYFFDFPHEAYIVVSLIPPPDMFADAFSRVLRFASAPGSSPPEHKR